MDIPESISLSKCLLVVLVSDDSHEYQVLQVSQVVLASFGPCGQIIRVIFNADPVNHIVLDLEQLSMSFLRPYIRVCLAHMHT